MYSKKLENKLNTLIKKYELNNKSPYSDSYYNSSDITWGFKPEGSLRLSDHWNFESCGELHCKTDCGTKNGWYLGQYSNGTYKLILKVFTDEELELEERSKNNYFNKLEKEAIKRAKKLAIIKSKLEKGSNMLISYEVSTKSGRHFSYKTIEEVCFCQGKWAHTSNGKKRVFTILEVK